MIIYSISFDFSTINTDSINLSVLGYTIVFLALVLLFSVFFFIPKILQYFNSQRMKRAGKHHPGESINTTRITGEESAAIAMAVYFFLNEIHDEESDIVTIKRISKRYSPWNSKIYTVYNKMN